MAPLYILASGVIGGTLLVYFASRTSSVLAKSEDGKPLPGPEQVPILGSLLKFPKRNWYETFTKWQKKYGDIIYLNLAGKSLFVLNSLEVADELMGKRANKSSGRPYRTMISEVMGAGWALIVLQPGPNFKAQRKLLRKSVGQQIAPRYDELIREEVVPLLDTLSKLAGDSFPIIQAAVGAIIIKIAYGETIFEEHGKQLVDTNRTRSEVLTIVLQTFWLVDVFSFLKYIPPWFPGAKFRRIGDQGREQGRQVRSAAYEMVKKAMEEGKADRSLISENINQPGFSNDDLRDAAASMYAAGADTTTTSIANFFFSMLLYPEVQKKVQQELDAAIGVNQIPTMDALRKLPYFIAVWKESMRWNPPVPLGVPHVYSKEDVWNGHYIPKGSIVQSNIGFMLRDPQIWGEDSDSFNPERWIPASNPRANQLPDMMGIPFGFGRRICPGRYLAERVGMIFAAATLSAFSIVPVDGEAAPQAMTFEDSIVRRPANLRSQFKQRQ